MSGWKRVPGIFIAVNGVGCGVAIFLQTGLGGDPIGILCEGLSHLLKIQFGHVSLLYNLLLIGLALLTAPKYVGVGSTVYALLSGYFIDLYSRLLSAFELQQQAFGVRLSVYALGLLLFTLSLAILIHFNLGMNALDAVLRKLSERYRISYIALRLINDFSYVGIGYWLGGTFGVGTVSCILLTGTLIKLFTGFLANHKSIQLSKEVVRYEI